VRATRAASVKADRLYREVFLSHHAEERTFGEPLRLGSRMVFVAYIILLAATALGIGTIATARIRDERFLDILPRARPEASAP